MKKQKLNWYVSIIDGKFVFRGGNPSFVHNVVVKASFTPDQIKEAKAFVVEHGLVSFINSSSVNWPEDNGLDEDFNAHAWLEKVIVEGHTEAAKARGSLEGDG